MNKLKSRLPVVLLTSFVLLTLFVNLSGFGLKEETKDVTPKIESSEIIDVVNIMPLTRAAFTEEQKSYVVNSLKNYPTPLKVSFEVEKFRDPYAPVGTVILNTSVNAGDCFVECFRSGPNCWTCFDHDCSRTCVGSGCGKAC